MKVLLAPTEDFIKRDRTSLTADVTAGAGIVIPVANSNGFAVNDYIVVGPEGSEQAELTIITAVATGQITATLLQAHGALEPIVKYRYNKRKFYGALTATGSYSELTGDGSPVTIKVGDPQGTLLEYTAGDGYAYFKATYYNSTTLEESNIADAEAVQADESLRYCSLYAIAHQAGLTNNPYITDGMLETYRKRAENEVRSIIMTRYILPLPEVPAIIENATTLLAAGYMDYKEFGSEGEGVKWLGEARGILNSIKNGTQRLIGADETELPYHTTSSQVQSYPNDVDAEGGQPQYFGMNKEF